MQGSGVLSLSFTLEGKQIPASAQLTRDEAPQGEKVFNKHHQQQTRTHTHTNTQTHTNTILLNSFSQLSPLKSRSLHAWFTVYRQEAVDG